MKKIILVGLLIFILAILCGCASTTINNSNENIIENVDTENKLEQDNSIENSIKENTVNNDIERNEINNNIIETEKEDLIKQEQTSEENMVAEEKEENIKKEPTSKYERAYIRELSQYSLYIMFDEDTKEAVYFGTNDTGVMNGTYTGTFESGVKICWSKEENWYETFTHKNNSSKAVLVDYSKFDWEYKTCDVSSAEQVMNNL